MFVHMIIMVLLVFFDMFHLHIFYKLIINCNDQIIYSMLIIALFKEDFKFDYFKINNR